MIQVISLLGAVCILVAYAGQHLGRLTALSYPYLVLNAVGALLLGYAAFFPFNPGFVLLETVWFVITMWTLVRMLRGRSSGPPDPLGILDADGSRG